MRKVINRVGERRIMNCGEEAEIVEYINYSDITIKFLKTREMVKSSYSNFKIGNIRSHFTPTRYGVGIVGDSNNIEKSSFITWANMLRRCYRKDEFKARPTYKDCKFCDEWLYYPNFKEWYKENYYKVNNQKMALDKDILNKGNKVYSPDTCVFVPQYINSLFVKSNSSRGNLPIGVYCDKNTKKYNIRTYKFNTTTKKSIPFVMCGFDVPEEAFNTYKKVKEENIKLVADYYKDQIPKKLYDAMYKYEVEITD